MSWSAAAVSYNGASRSISSHNSSGGGSESGAGPQQASLPARLQPTVPEAACDPPLSRSDCVTPELTMLPVSQPLAAPWPADALSFASPTRMYPLFQSAKQRKVHPLLRSVNAMLLLRPLPFFTLQSESSKPVGLQADEVAVGGVLGTTCGVYIQ